MDEKKQNRDVWTVQKAHSQASYFLSHRDNPSRRKLTEAPRPRGFHLPVGAPLQNNFIASGRLRGGAGIIFQRISGRTSCN